MQKSVPEISMNKCSDITLINASIIDFLTIIFHVETAMRYSFILVCNLMHPLRILEERKSAYQNLFGYGDKFYSYKQNVRLGRDL